MACPRCAARIQLKPIHSSKSTLTGRRSFHVSSPRRRLGAATYQQEWQTGAYHYNKQTTKNHPVAAQTANRLIEMYMTMQRPTASATKGAARTAIASRRRSMEKVFVSSSMAKDFGNKVVVDAFVYDGVQGLAKEREERRALQMAARNSQGSSSQGTASGEQTGQNRRGPLRGGRAPAAGAGAGAGPGAGRPFRSRPGGLPGRVPGRVPGRTSRGGAAAGGPSGTTFRSIKLNPSAAGKGLATSPLPRPATSRPPPRQ